MQTDYHRVSLDSLVKHITDNGHRNFIGNLQKIQLPLAKSLALLTLRRNRLKGSFRVEWHNVLNRLQRSEEMMNHVASHLLHRPNYRFYPLYEMFLLGRLYLQGCQGSGIEEADSIIGLLTRIDTLSSLHSEPEQAQFKKTIRSMDSLLESFADHFSNAAEGGFLKPGQEKELLINGNLVSNYLTHFAGVSLQSRWRYLGLYSD